MAAVANGAILPVFGLMISKMVNTLYEPAAELQIDSKNWALIFVALGMSSFLIFPTRSYLFAFASKKLIKRVRLLISPTLNAMWCMKNSIEKRQHVCTISSFGAWFKASVIRQQSKNPCRVASQPDDYAVQKSHLERNLDCQDQNYSQVSFPLKYREIFNQKNIYQSISVRIRPTSIERQVITYF